jgi:hypothetical protein
MLSVQRFPEKPMAIAYPRPTEAGPVAFELQARVAALDAAADRMAAGAILNELDSLRRIAAANGIGPAVTVIHAIDAALSRGERGALVHGWLQILGEAVASGRCDAAAHDAFAGACSVRLSGG